MDLNRFRRFARQTRYPFAMDDKQAGAINLAKLVVFLQASKLGFGVYERLGFSVHDHYERFTVTPPL